jgi:predicted transposase/invertase (TIGR01784 family)
MGQTQKINPRVDFAFKLIFEKHTDLLIGLINAIVSDYDQVQEIEIKNPYNQKQRQKDKLSVLDIKAKNKKTGTWFNIEIQINDDASYKKRSLYYWSKLYSDQLQSGTTYDTLNKTISINVLNFNMLPDKGYHNIYKIKNDKTNEILTDMLELHYIELKKVSDDLNKIKTALDRWVSLLARAEKLTSDTLPEALNKDKLIKKAMKVFETTTFNDDEWNIYEARLKWWRDELSIILTAEARGEARGEAKGIKKGKSEARINIAQSMKKEGLSVKQIVKITGLNEKEIE